MTDAASLRQMSVVRNSNTSLSGLNITGAGFVNTADNSFRELSGQLAEYLVEMSYPVAGGTANALTLTPTTALAALTSNQAYSFKAASANTTAATLAVSGLTAKAIRKIVGGTDVALAANDIQANGRYTVVYDTAANAAAGAWILTGTPPEVGVSIDGLTAKTTPVDADEFILADSAASFLGKKVTGANLKKYGLNGLVIRVQTFTGSGTYTPNANMVYCILECVGAGGAGGGIGGATSQAYGGGGGGSGGYSRTVSSLATIGASQTVTIGAAGTGTSNANGGNGGATSVGTLCVANGGGGGKSVANFSDPGTAATAGTGTVVAATGQSGSFGVQSPSTSVTNARSGAGGNSMLGGGAGATGSVGAANAGAAATTYGGGGAGAAALNSATNAAGGNGFAGYVMVTEFCSA